MKIKEEVSIYVSVCVYVCLYRGGGKTQQLVNKSDVILNHFNI